MLAIYAEYAEKGKPQVVLEALRVKIAELADQFNVGKNMTAAQITTAAEMVYDDYKNISFKEIDFAFSKLVRGKYPVKILDSFDARHVFECLEHYMRERMEAIESKHSEAQVERMRTKEREPISPETELLLQQFKEKLSANSAQAEKKVELSAEVLEHYEAERKRFDDLRSEFLQLPSISEDGRLRMFEGYANTLQQFLTKKMYYEDDTTNTSGV